MAIYKRDIVDIDLSTGNIHRTFMAHTIGYKDQKADHFGVRVFRDGEAVSLTGVSVQGVFMPPQGSPIAITSGNIVSGNTAEVVLPQACYDYNGQFCLAIKLVDSSNSVTGTVRIVDGVVDNTHASGTVAPTSAVPTYQEVLSAYEQAIAVIGYSVRFDTTQSLTTAQKTTARGNIDAASTDDVSALKSALDSTDVQLGLVEGSILQTDDALGLKTSQATLTPSIGSTLYRPNNRLAILNPFYVRGKLKKVTVYANIGNTAGYTGKLYCGVVDPDVVHAGVAGVAPASVTTIAKQYKAVTAGTSSQVADQTILTYDFSSDNIPSKRILYILLYVEPDNPSNVIYIKGLNYYANNDDFPLDFLAVSDTNPVFVTVAGTTTLTQVGATSNNYMPIKLEIDGEVKAPDYPFVTELTGVRGTNVILDSSAKYTAPYDDANTLPIGTIVSCSYPATGKMANIPKGFRLGTIMTLDYKNTETLGTQVQIAIDRFGVVSIRHKFSSWGEWQSNYEMYGGFATFPSVGVVGDSFSSGGIYITAGTIWNMYPQYSWPTIAGRMYGSTFSNYSSAGLSTRTWLTNTSVGLSKLLADDPSDLYVLCLGTNDGGIYNDDPSYLGSVADIHDDPSQNPDTFYGNYGKIISNIKSHAPNAKIVLITMWAYGTPSETYNLFLTSEAEIASKFSIPHIQTLKDQYFNSTYFQTDGKSQAHPVAITYGGAAVAFNRMLGRCMMENPSYFFDLH